MTGARVIAIAGVGLFVIWAIMGIRHAMVAPPHWDYESVVLMRLGVAGTIVCFGAVAAVFITWLWKS